ncbi:hypothetical protein BBH99_01655 [Chryseobacterium contaminans]|uniref:Dolichyl-phosphate-mannose-protein mannosyltransferase n=1 Tax=Chryseobacterium contaminans TaxID=1423959 RepID=A0A1M7IAR7_9FLAO|nr:hypothetical protein [Chryseobacterium contaminans]OCA78014.1 hypothetical protein BBH99_01655 [Chryseobacterium contaminans]SHM37749.1 hypothetical protein SAMN05444407_11421 [Chryseobacterium contaminans]
MLIKNDEKINGFLFVAVLPFLLFAMAYYGFESSYVRLKTMEKAPDFMFSSVYAYRVIPNYLSIHVTEAVTFMVNNYVPFLKNFLLKQGTLFYHSIFLINSFFFVLSSVVLNSLLKLNPTGVPLHLNIRRMIHLLAVFFIVIAQYVPTNCDSIAIFFYLLGALLTLKYLENRKRIYFILLCLVVFVSTLARESSCLNISFFAAMCIDFEKLKSKDFTFIKEIVLLVIAFVIPYAGLRMMIHQNVSFVEGVYFLDNFSSPFNLSGLLFGILSLYFSYLLCDEKGQVIIRKYLFFAIPYLIMIAMVGLFWETRLFLPLILTGIVTAAHQFKNVIPQQRDS